MLVLLEDGEDSPFVQLLKLHGVPMRGVGGSGNLRGIAREECKRNDVVYAIIDVVPDNPCTLKEYRGLLTVQRRFAPNLIPLPIVCMEELFFRGLRSLGVQRLELKPFEFRNIEEYYKGLMDSVIAECAQVGHKRPYVGKYYTQPCVCCDTHGHVTSMAEKADYFWSLLPVDHDVMEYMSWFTGYINYPLISPTIYNSNK